MIKPPLVKHKKGPLHHSDLVRFKVCKYGWKIGFFFKQSGGFYRDSNSGLDYDPISVLKWEFVHNKKKD